MDLIEIYNRRFLSQLDHLKKELMLDVCYSEGYDSYYIVIDNDDWTEYHQVADYLGIDLSIYVSIMIANKGTFYYDSDQEEPDTDKIVDIMFKSQMEAHAAIDTLLHYLIVRGSAKK